MRTFGEICKVVTVLIGAFMAYVVFYWGITDAHLGGLEAGRAF